MVQAILQTLFDKGEIYFGEYGGQYCFGCERFYTEKEIVDGKCPDHQTPLTSTSRRRTTSSGCRRTRTGSSKHLEEHPDFIQPERYRNEVLGFLREPLQDLSISRPKSRLQWGIPLPVRRPVRDLRLVRRADQLRLGARASRTATAFQRYWPHVQHLIGKDILKPHGDLLADAC